MVIKLSVKKAATVQEINDYMIQLVGLLPSQWSYNVITTAFIDAVKHWKSKEENKWNGNL